MTDTKCTLTTLGYGNRIIHYRFENTSFGSHLLQAFARSYQKRLTFDDKVKLLCIRSKIILSQNELINDGLTVAIISGPLGVYANPHGYVRQIAERAALYSGLPLYQQDLERGCIQIGIGNERDGVGEYFLLKDILFWLPMQM